MRDDMEELLGRLTPRGVRPELRAKVLDGFQKGTVPFSSDENRDSPQVVLSQVLRRIVKMKSVKVSVGALVAASVAALLMVVFRPVPSAFADALKSMREAHTISYTMSTILPGRSDGFKMKQYYRDDGRMQAEFPKGIVFVMDLVGKRSIILDANRKSATVSAHIDLKAPGSQISGDILMQLVKEAEGKVEKELGEKELDGKKVRVFLSKVGGRDGTETTFWVDKATGQPVRIETDRPAGGSAKIFRGKVAMTDIHIDPKLDDSLFSLEPPPGYKVSQMTMPKVGPGETKEGGQKADK